jgi:hypothetical protein
VSRLFVTPAPQQGDLPDSLAKPHRAGKGKACVTDLPRLSVLQTEGWAGCAGGISLRRPLSGQSARRVAGDGRLATAAAKARGRPGEMGCLLGG